MTVLEIIEKARQAQQKFDKNNDVQLELDWRGDNVELLEDQKEESEESSEAV